MLKISVIIPVYNSAASIYKTLLSIHNQTYKNYEALIINDGSTDNSEDLILKFIKNKKEFKYYKTPNYGVSHARNIGLKNMTGDLVCFLDSDDYLDTNYFQNITNDIKDYDMLFYGYKTIKDTTKIHTLKKDIICKNKKEFFEKLDKNELFAPICNKVYTKEIVKNIYFDEELSIGEDFNFTSKCFIKASKIKYLNKCYYNYQVGLNGLGFKKRTNIFETNYKILKDISSFYDVNNYSKVYLNNIYVKSYFKEIILLDNINTQNITNLNKEINKVIDLKTIKVSLKYKLVLKLLLTKNKFLIKVISKSLDLIDRINKYHNFGLKRS